jgi:hypothetical protein
MVGEDLFGEVGCAVAPVPLPSSGGRGPVKPVALEFSADPFRRNLGKKDLETINLNVIDQAHATRKLLFSGFVVLDVLDCGQALLKRVTLDRAARRGLFPRCERPALGTRRHSEAR